MYPLSLSPHIVTSQQYISSTALFLTRPQPMPTGVTINRYITMYCHHKHGWSFHTSTDKDTALTLIRLGVYCMSSWPGNMLLYLIHNNFNKQIHDTLSTNFLNFLSRISKVFLLPITGLMWWRWQHLSNLHPPCTATLQPVVATALLTPDTKYHPRQQ